MGWNAGSHQERKLVAATFEKANTFLSQPVIRDRDVGVRILSPQSSNQPFTAAFISHGSCFVARLVQNFTLLASISAVHWIGDRRLVCAVSSVSTA